MPSVQLSTFLKWKIHDTVGGPIGFLSDKTEDGKEVISKIWCRICAKHYEKIFTDSRIKGAAKSELKTYVEGTTFITKHNANRHLSSTVRFSDNHNFKA